jgi:hypothetical protein
MLKSTAFREESTRIHSAEKPNKLNVEDRVAAPERHVSAIAAVAASW